MLQTDALHVARATLEQQGRALDEFHCPSHHLELYHRTQQALNYLMEPHTLERVVFVDQPTFAPACADMVPDSGVCFLRCAPAGPKDLAAAVERGAVSSGGLFLRLWDDALGYEFDEWRSMVDGAPVIFVRLGCSVCSPEGRWHWAPLEGEHQSIGFADVRTAFAVLIAEARRAGDEERAQTLELWQYGILAAA